MLSDLIDELIWPRILRAPALAISPNRLISGCAGVFLIALILNIYNTLRETPDPSETNAFTPSITERFAGILDAIISLDFVAFANQIVLAIYALRDNVMHNPLLALMLGIPMVFVLALVGGTISRSAAFEFAQGRFASREETVQFTLQRARQFLGATIGPILFATALLFIIAIGGKLLSFPVVDLFGALLYPVALIFGAIASIVMILHLIALPMIVPALSIEGTDAFDAIQRCYAYVIGRPIRYFLYAILLTLVGSIAATVFAMLIGLSQEMTDWSLNYFFSLATESALTGQGELGATKSLSFDIIQAFRGVLKILIAGYFVSLFFTSGTLLYLATRRICDGQGITEIWEPIQNG